jgi:hypothetical protein
MGRGAPGIFEFSPPIKVVLGWVSLFPCGAKARFFGGFGAIVKIE